MKVLFDPKASPYHWGYVDGFTGKPTPDHLAKMQDNRYADGWFAGKSDGAEKDHHARPMPPRSFRRINVM